MLKSAPFTSHRNSAPELPRQLGNFCRADEMTKLKGDVLRGADSWFEISFFFFSFFLSIRWCRLLLAESNFVVPQYVNRKFRYTVLPLSFRVYRCLDLHLDFLLLVVSLKRVAFTYPPFEFSSFKLYSWIEWIPSSRSVLCFICAINFADILIEAVGKPSGDECCVLELKSIYPSLNFGVI